MLFYSLLTAYFVSIYRIYSATRSVVTVTISARRNARAVYNFIAYYSTVLAKDGLKIQHYFPLLLLIILKITKKRFVVVMCLFPYRNLNEDGKAYKHGLTMFECGGCPECLSKKSRLWALRASMQAKSSPAMMLTLTYDTYKYDTDGNIIGENPPQAMSVDKRDCQNFVKRLRSKFPDKDIKYIISAEYGKRTHRAHYHALIFGLVFEDIYFYKRSKRGNIIYRSPTLEQIWQGGKEKKGGICTVDSVNMSAQIARYCTKYCAKDSGADDTFMLFSRGIGVDNLLKYFNGKSYWVDGREYSIPRDIWRRVIEQRYNIHGYSKYINFPKPVNGYVKTSLVKAYFEQSRLRELYSLTRDSDLQYRAYIDYWREKNRIVELTRPDVLTRIHLLPDEKYRTYKLSAIKCLTKSKNLESYQPPRSGSRAIVVRNYSRGLRRYVIGICPPTCHNTANDRIQKRIVTKNGSVALLWLEKWQENEKNPFQV